MLDVHNQQSQNAQPNLKEYEQISNSEQIEENSDPYNNFKLNS